MEQIIHELIGLVREEETALLNHLKLLLQQKEQLSKGEISLFQKTFSQQDELIETIRRFEYFEERRIAKVNELAGVLGLNPEEITLTRLIEITTGEISEELGQLKECLSRMVMLLREMNDGE